MKHIIVVDNIPRTQLYTNALKVNPNYEVEPTNDTGIALRMAQCERPHLMVAGLKYDAGGMAGPQLVREAHDASPTTKFILCGDADITSVEPILRRLPDGVKYIEYLAVTDPNQGRGLAELVRSMIGE